MNGIPKTRYTGLVIIIVLFLVLIMAFLTMISRHANEERLIEKGFITLYRNTESIRAKINNYEILKIYPKLPRSFEEKPFRMKILTDSIYLGTNLPVSDSFPTASRFISDILDRSFFDEYIVFKGDTILYKSIKSEALSYRNYLAGLKKNLYVPPNYNIFSNKKDSSLRSSWNTGFITKVIINYNKYYQFVYPVKISNTTWYISGLLTNQNYLEKKQHVESWVLILVCILLIFTLFSIQFVKLFLLSKTERINTSDLVLICFSISGIACIIPLLILNIYTLTGIKSNRYAQLKILNDTIKNNFLTEVELMYKTTADFEHFKKNDYAPVKNVLTNSEWKSNNTDLWSTIQSYPYMKELFGSTGNISKRDGKSDDIITTWENDTNTLIFFRPYFQKKDEWILPGDDKSKRFRLQSLLSNTSGDVSVVLAKPSISRSDTIYGISTPMYSILNTVLPPGYEFRIIGVDGMVWFHNNQKKNNRENFLEECDFNSHILEAIHNRIETSMPMKISMKNYQTHIAPIGSLPLYMITLSSTTYQNEFLSHINYIILIFVLLGIFCALVSTALFYYEKLNKNTNYRDKEPGLIWLFPDQRKNQSYLILVFTNILMAVFLIIPGFFRTTTIVHYLLILFSAYSLCFIYVYYILKSDEKKAFRKSVPLVFAIVFIFCNILYSICLKNFGWFLFIEALIIVPAGIILTKYKRQVITIEPGKFKWIFKDKYRPYQFFVFSWMIVTCAIPTILLFKIASHEEVELVIRKNQLELAARIEQKNLQIDSLYIEHIYPKNSNIENLDKIKDQLKHHGNYLLYYNAKYPVDSNISKRSPGAGDENNYFLLNKYLRLLLKREDIRNYQMLYEGGLDSRWYWSGGHLKNPHSNLLSLYYSANQKNVKGFYSGYQMMISTLLLNPINAKTSNALRIRLVQLAVFLIFILMLFFFIRTLVNNLFILKKPSKIKPISSAEIPSTGKILLISILEQDKVKAHLKSHILISPDVSAIIQMPEKALFIFNPTPENLKDWHATINMLEQKMDDYTGNIVCLSCYSPQQIFNMIAVRISNKDNDQDKKSLNEIKHKLIHLFSYFDLYYFRDKMVKDDLTASEYQYLWERCTLNEKFILSDLAIDSVVNGKNRDDIGNLIGKGILKVKGKLRFVNKGFDRYVLELAHTDEFTELEKDSKRADGWNRIKTPLYIIFGAVVIFFFFTQQDYISIISGAILSITGLMGTLLKFGLFGKSGGDSK